MIRKVLGRLSDLFSSRTYRRVLWARFLDYLLRSLNPNIKYFGLIDGDGLILLNTGDSAVTPYAIAENGFQKEDVNKAIELAEKHSCALGGIFLDIGAHIGTSAIYAIKSGKFNKAFCFEPVPKNIAHLELNVKLNNLEGICKVVPKAVTKQDSLQTMYLSDSNTGDNRLTGGSGLTSQGLNEKIEVEGVSLDSFLEKENVDIGDISFAWLDTQGNEGNVLAGAKKILDRRVPICLEFWPWALKENDNFDQLVDLLQDHYAVFYDLRNLQAGYMKTDTIREYSSRFTTDLAHTDLLVLKAD